MKAESDQADNAHRGSARTLSSLFNSFKSALRKSRKITRYHIIEYMDEWLALEYNILKTIVLDEINIPKFEFNIKIVNSSKYCDLFIHESTIIALQEIGSEIKRKSIEYRPSDNMIKYLLNYIDSLPINPPIVPHQYPQPFDYQIALAVVTQLFDTRDVLGTENDDSVVYYYLCVLAAIKHPLINHARHKLNFCTTCLSVYDCAKIPTKGKKPNIQMCYHTLYAELLYFLSLFALPNCTGDNVQRIASEIRIRYAEQLKTLCDAVGITKYEPIHRGESWQKLIRFLKANPQMSRVLATTILKPPKIEDPLTVIEDQVINQVKQIWRWAGLQDFQDCYEFASSEKKTEAHSIPVIAKECKRVISLYEKLKVAVVNESLVPYAKLLINDDADFFEYFEAYNYPDLFYASRSYMTPNKLGNLFWEEFVAKTKVTVQRRTIDEKLMIPLSNSNEVAPSDGPPSSVDVEELPSPHERTFEIINNKDAEDSVSLHSDHFRDDVEDPSNSDSDDHDPEWAYIK